MAYRPITMESAISLTRWQMQQEVDNPDTGMVKRFALNATLKGDEVETRIGQYYAMGLALSAEDQNPTIREWAKSGALIWMSPRG